MNTLHLQSYTVRKVHPMKKETKELTIFARSWVNFESHVIVIFVLHGQKSAMHNTNISATIVEKETKAPEELKK